MASYGTPTDFPELLSAVETRVRVACGLQKRQVFWTLRSYADLAASPPGKTFVSLRPLRFAPNLPQVAGGGVASFDGVLAVSLWHQFGTDQALAAGGHLTDEGRGAMPVWAKLLAALHLFSPTNAAEQEITTEPMRLAPAGLDFADKPPQQWGRLDSAWQLKFVHRLT